MYKLFTTSESGNGKMEMGKCSGKDIIFHYLIGIV